MIFMLTLTLGSLVGSPSPHSLQLAMLINYSIQNMSPRSKCPLGKLPPQGDNKLIDALSTSTFSTMTNPATPDRYKSLALPLRSYFSTALGWHTAKTECWSLDVISEDGIVVNWIGSVDCVAAIGSNDADNEILDSLCSWMSAIRTSIRHGLNW